MKTKIILAIGGIILVAALLAGAKFLQISKMIAAGAEMVPPAEAVTTAEVTVESWQPTIAAIGSVLAAKGVTVSAELPGTVTEIAFESGADVAAGQLLVQLDVSSEKAQLRAGEARVELAKLNLDRARDLKVTKTIAQSEADSAEAAYKQAVADADAIRVSIGKKTIRAAFAGRLGIRQINLGQYLNVGLPIVSLQALDPVYVDFSLPQQHLSKLGKEMDVRVTADSFPGRTFAGKLSAIDPDLDPATRSIRLRATFDNPEGMLRPGMFAKVEVILPEKEPLPVIPATAILNAPYGDSVFVVEDSADKRTGKPAKLLRQQFVRSGESRGDYVSIRSGLKPGETVVTTGVFKLRNGMAVTVDNALAPDATLTPAPADS